MSNQRDPITLDFPLKRGEKEITKVTLRKPNSGALRGLKVSALLDLDILSIQTLLPRISDPLLTKAEVEQLDPADITQLGTEIASFFVPKAMRASE